METHSGIDKLKRILGAVVAVLVTAFLFSRSGMAREVHTSLGQKKPRTVLRVWDWWSPSTDEKFGKYFAATKQEFEALHPDVELVFQYVPFSQYEQKMAVALVGNSPPDVFQSSVAWAEGFYDRGMLKPLNSYLDSPQSKALPPELRLTRDRYLESAWRHNTKADGTVFGIPQILDANCLAWNLDLLKEAAQTNDEIRGMFAANTDGSPNYTHLKPDCIKDWEMFRRVTKKLTKTDPQGNVTQAGLALHAHGNGASVFMPWWAANGTSFQDSDGKKALFDSPEGVEATRFILDLYWKDKVSFPFRRQLDVDEVFNQGKSGCVVSGTWAGKYTRRNTDGKLRFDMTPFPPGPHGNGQATVAWGNMLVIPKRARQAELAWKYIQFICSKSGSLRLLKYLGQNSPRLDFYDTPEWGAMCRKYPDLTNIPAICASGKKLRHTQSAAVDYASQSTFETLLLHYPEIEQGKGAFPSLEVGVGKAAGGVNRVYERYNRQVAQWQRMEAGQ